MSAQFYPIEVERIERLTPDAVAIDFAVAPEHRELFAFHQGQHLTLEAQIQGESVRRSYSISCATRSGQLQVGVKKIPGGAFSSFANESLKVGDVLQAMPPQGHFYTQMNPQQCKHYALIAAGSGITPLLSTAETVLSCEPDAKVTLLYANKTSQSMMFKERLSFLKNRYMSRFQWINVFTREEQDATVLNGRIDGERLHALEAANVIQLDAFDEYMLCGPQQMILSVEEVLQQRGVSSESIHYELFYADAQEPVELSAEQLADTSEKEVVVKASGRKLRLALQGTGVDILESALEHGLDLPYSCKGGVCATCKAKVISGEVRMDRNHSLTSQEVEQGYVLSCQAHPVSQRVEIDFDI
ncbi:MAG: 1,2-phenylacetyl-CoA epoxidase subunit PaaE [Pseudomonadales bacterium]